MSKFTTTVAIAAVSMALTAQASSGAEIWLEYHPQTPTIYIKGGIAVGDYEVFKQVAYSDKRLRKGKHLQESQRPVIVAGLRCPGQSGWCHF